MKGFSPLFETAQTGTELVSSECSTAVVGG